MREIGLIRSRLSPAIVAVAAIALSLGATEALAVCGNPATQLIGGNPGTLAPALSGMTICVGSANNWVNQEYLSGGTTGPIYDWKKGPSDPKDPTAIVGQWTVVGDNVTFTYTAGGTFTFTVWRQAGGTLDFCNATTAVVSGALVRSGQGPC